LQVKLYEVKEEASKLIINDSSLGTLLFVRGSFKMTKDIFAKVKIIEIGVKYVYK
jgi:hypothetical protein